MRPRVMIVYGTRPEAIKIAPLVWALNGHPVLAPVTVATGQHREMLASVAATLGLEPDSDLGIFEPGASISQIAARVLDRLDPVLAAAGPAAVVVQGDTSTAFAAALAAFHRRIPVVHLEAGLRTGDLFSPFPEEANRRLVSRIASLHLAPTASNRDNLLAEGIDPAAVAVTGNTVIDALLKVAAQPHAWEDPRLAAVADGAAAGRRVITVTAHRRESWGEALAGVGRALGRVARDFPDVVIVLPAHRNPVVRETLLPSLDGLANVIVTEPLPYGEFTHLLALSHLVVTDSGGLQEEAPALGKPVLVIRDNTERGEAVEAGTVRLIGTGEDAIVAHVRELLTDPAAYGAMAHAVNPYGDGHAAARCVDAIARFLGV